MSRSATALLAIVFMAEVALFAIIPVVPIYVDQFGLSKLQAGALVSASAIAVAIVSIPAGLMSDRIGAKRMTIISAGLLTVSAFGQAFADSFVTVLAMRIVFGFGSSAVWTSGLSWLSDVSDDRSRSSTVGATATVAGVGSLVGPLFAGYIAEQFSVEAAFLVIGVATAVVSLGLLVVPQGVSHMPESPAIGRSLSLVRHNPRIIAALVLMAVAGFVDGFVNLLAPLELTADGLSSTGTGLVFSIASGLFIVASWLVTRTPRLATLEVAGYSLLIQAATFVPVLISLGVVSVTFMEIARSPMSGVLYTVAMPVAVVAARSAGLGTATVSGTVGTVWGTTSLISSPLAGAIADSVGDRAVYALAVVLLVAVGVWILRRVATQGEDVGLAEVVVPEVPGHP